MKLLTRYQMRMAVADQDEELLARLKIACWHESYTGLLPDELLDSLHPVHATRQWAGALSGGIAWIAEQAGAGVGFSHMRHDEITMLYVRKSDQGCGIGRELLFHAFEESACLGHRQAYLWVLEDNHAARGFYEAMGGVLCNRRSVGYPRWPHIMEVRYDFPIDKALSS